MKKSLMHLLAMMALLPCLPVHAAPANGDIFADGLFPPELIVQNAEAINLTDAQREFIASEVDKVQDRFKDLQQKLEKETAATAAMLKQDKVDESAFMEQFDKLFSREREIRRAHLSLLLSFKNKLTLEQREKLQALKQQQSAGGNSNNVQTVIQEKVKKVQAGMEKWAADGRDPSEVGELMQNLGPLMKQWKFKEAEALIDRALKILDDK